MCAVSPNWEGSVICECAQCGQDIYKEYSYYKDNDGNCFCSEECGVSYHGIRETDLEGEYGL